MNLVWAWLASAGLLASCASFQERDDIAVSLVNVRLGEATVFETTAVFTVRIANESPNPLVLDGGVHKFYLNGLNVGEGLSGDRLEVPRFASVTQDIPVHLGNISLATRIRPIIESRALDYRMNSRLLLLGNRSHTVRVSHEGHLSLEQFQPTFPGRSQTR